MVKWGILGVLAGALAGTASALFLRSLEWATNCRERHGWLLFLLPFAGIAMGWAYQTVGKSVEAGNNLLLEHIHRPDDNSTQGASVPLRMFPLILLATVATHLFGGSAGREGTALQMGGALASNLYRLLNRVLHRLPDPMLTSRDHALLLMAGIAGGFGSVFGTPLAGAVFGLEVLTVGQVRYDGILGCLTASVVGDIVCKAWGAHHTHYAVGAMPDLTPTVWLWILVAGILFGLASRLFSELTHAIGHLAMKHIAHPALRPFVGGLLVIALTYIVGTRDYLGLSLPLIQRTFYPSSAEPILGTIFIGAFALKILFTAITLGTGFKGGEVTPLFGIGATLGYTIAHLTGQPTAFFAALGFVAVFAGAANTPLACTLMGIELFGSKLGIPLATACFLSYFTSGHRGIYLSQRVAVAKHGTVDADTTLRQLRERNE